jgi:syntaxin 5
LRIGQRIEGLSHLTKNDLPFRDQRPREDEFVHTVKGDLSSLRLVIGAIRVPVGLTDPDVHGQNMVQILANQCAETTRAFHTAITALYAKRQEQEKRRSRIGASRVMLDTTVTEGSTTEGSLMIAMPTLRTQRPELTLLLERASEFRDLEANVIEVGTMMRQLAVLTAAHNEQILRIDANLTMADRHVTEGHRQLSHYLSSISNNRWLAVKLFGVLLFFIVLFVLFFI